ncbi:MAG TPA: alanine racemase [Chthonomonadales bacterium]|nr:alanine racemase [Chthonomonadales bacterium]
MPERPQALRAWAEVDLEAVKSNAAAIVKLAGPAAVMAVVKADAYGHGLIPVARAALAGGAACLGVATVEEGAALRAAGLNSPISLLCGFALPEAASVVAHRLIASVGDVTSVEAIARAAQPGTHPEVHLEIDTGMGRAGVLPGSAVSLYRKAKAAGLNVTGMFTHFADADGADPGLTLMQQQQFHNAAGDLAAEGAQIGQFHLCNSAAAIRLDSGCGTLVRPGLLLYGIVPLACSRRDLPPLKPALALKAAICSVRSLPRGATISYGATHRLARDSRVATMLLGYGDGYPRRLSNRGCVLLHGRRAPILGRVCMDQTVLDVTGIPQAAAGDIAVCIGEDGTEQITVEQIAEEIDTTEHEITTCLTKRVPRLHLQSTW